MLCVVLAIAFLSVCPSVCPSVVRRYCVKTNERRMMLSSLTGSIVYLGFGDDIRLIDIFTSHP